MEITWRTEGEGVGDWERIGDWEGVGDWERVGDFMICQTHFPFYEIPPSSPESDDFSKIINFPNGTYCNKNWKGFSIKV